MGPFAGLIHTAIPQQGDMQTIWKTLENNAIKMNVQGDFLGSLCRFYSYNTATIGMTCKIIIWRLSKITLLKWMYG